MDDNTLKKLKEIAGAKNATNSPEILEDYSADQSFTPACRPHYVVFPESSEQVETIIKYANEIKIPVVPKSSAVSLHGGSIPKEGGILVDLKKMNKILEINVKNRYVVI